MERRGRGMSQAQFLITRRQGETIQSHVWPDQLLLWKHMGAAGGGENREHEQGMLERDTNLKSHEATANSTTGDLGLSCISIFLNGLPFSVLSEHISSHCKGH